MSIQSLDAKLYVQQKIKQKIAKKVEFQMDKKRFIKFQR